MMRLTIAKIAELIEGSFSGDGEKEIVNVASFETAGPDTITYAGNSAYIKMTAESKAGAVIVPDGTDASAANLVYVSNPRAAFSKLMDIFNPLTEPSDSIHSSVVAGKSLVLGKKVTLKPGVVLGDTVIIGDRVTLYPNVVIGNNVMIGSDVIVYPNSVIQDGSVVGNRVIIHSGTVIGSDGYGFVHDGSRYTKIRHIGIVRIDDDVEIGANNTIDRGTYGETWIKSGVKTDNQVHVAHNVVVGENTLLVAQVGIAGSTQIGDNAILAGKAGVAGHLKVGNGAVLGPGAGVLQSVNDNEVVSGTPGMPHGRWLRVQNIISKLPDFIKKIRQLEKRIGNLENTGE